jgi:hypothetical protein
MKKAVKSKDESSQSPAPFQVKENQSTNLPSCEISKNRTTTNKDNLSLKFRGSPFNPDSNFELRAESRLDRQRSKEVIKVPETNDVKGKKRKTHMEEIAEDIKFSPISKPMVIKKKSKLLYPGDEFQVKNLRSGVFNRYLPKQSSEGPEENSNQTSARQLPNIYSNYQEKRQKPKAEDPDTGGGPHPTAFQVEDLVQLKRYGVCN